MLNSNNILKKIENHVKDENYNVEEKDVTYHDYCDRYDDCFDAGYSKGYAKALHEINNILKGLDIED